MKAISLFAGVGGFDIAIEAMGWETLAIVEWDRYCNYVTVDRFPNAEKYNDIKSTDFTKYRGTVGIVCGGFPCQPYSLAGQRKVNEDDRHLWPEMLRVVREVKPKWVLAENVPGLITWGRGIVFHEVCTSLETEGYEVLPVVLPAAGVGAPHRRDRIWIIAYNPNSRIEGMRKQEIGIHGLKSSTYTSSKGGEARQRERTYNEGWEMAEPIQNNRSDIRNRIEPNGIHGITPNSNINIGPERREYQEGIKEAKRHTGPLNSWSSRYKWEDFPTQSPICTGDDGISSEMVRAYVTEHSGGVLTEKEINTLVSKTISKYQKESIKQMGNAVVPQVVQVLLMAINNINNS